MPKSILGTLVFLPLDPLWLRKELMKYADASNNNRRSAGLAGL
jgi:hypothetical protein